MTHVMLDLETWGTTPGSAIRSIGACVFDPDTGEIGETFYRNVTDESCEAAGLTKSEGTKEFWARPENAEAQAHLAADQVPLDVALLQFTDFFADAGLADERGDMTELWAFGPNFDETIATAAYHAVGQEAPWHYRAPRCARTICALAGVDVPRIGTHHNALDDCKNQVAAVTESYHRLGLGLPAVAEVIRDGALARFLTGAAGLISLRWVDNGARIEWIEYETPPPGGVGGFGETMPYTVPELIGRGAPRAAA